MRIRANKPQIKAMAFAGCSFTWGQGLWYYANLNDPPQDPHYGYNPAAVRALHHVYRERWRWPSRVADHFGTVGITHYQNGGANDQIVEWWTKSFTSKHVEPVKSFHWKVGEVDRSRPINFSDVSDFVFQFTNWARSSIVFPVNGKNETIDVQTTWDKTSRYHEPFLDWFDNQDIKLSSPNMTKVGEFHQLLMQRDIDQVKNLLQLLEKNGVKTYVLLWPHEHYPNLIENDSWLMDRFIFLDYNGKRYDCIDHLIKNEENMSLETDYEFFEEPPNDGHPSLKCQAVIADNVIRAIERRNNNG